MTTTDYDAIVIGGGPAGAAAATYVAQAGHRVLLVERRPGPTFKVGESLIPATFGPLERLGLIDELRRSHFTKKYSVQFFSGNGKPSKPFYFSETDPSDRSQTWQVLRSEFDPMLLANAERHGVEVCSGVSVKDLLFDGERVVGVETRGAEGETRQLSSRVVMDATGQRAMLSRRFGLRRPDPCLQMAAIFTHFEGAHRDSGRDEGATLIIQTQGNRAWFWFIPLPENRASVGVVGPIDYLVRGRQGDPQAVFDEEIGRCPALQPRLTEARQTMDVKVLNDFSYVSERAAGDGWVLVGDAFGFLDPMYSSGVLLAFAGAEMAADAVIDALAADDPSAERLRAFEPRLRDGMSSFRQLVYAFYSPEFNFARFLKRHPEHRLAIVDILVGDVFDRDFSALFADLGRMLATPGTSGDAAAKTMAATEQTA